MNNVERWQEVDEIALMGEFTQYNYQMSTLKVRFVLGKKKKKKQKMYKLTVSCKGKMTPSQIKSDWVSSLGDRIGGDLEVKLACGKTKTVQLESMCRKEVPAGLRT